MIYNRTPHISLISFITSPSKLAKLIESDIEMNSQNGWFLYSWEITENKSEISFKSVKIFKDIIECYNLMIDYIKRLNQKCLTKMEVNFIYQPKIFANMLEIMKKKVLKSDVCLEEQGFHN